VLYETMSAVGLDYLFVSRHALRDGLMVDLLRRTYSDAESGIPTPTAPSRSSRSARSICTTGCTPST
jgi:hypothetical protein